MNVYDARVWRDRIRLQPKRYKCGHCNIVVGPDTGYTVDTYDDTIYICSHCYRPTYFRDMGYYNEVQIPGATYGEPVDHVPEIVQRLYEEARRCASANAPQAVVMLCRKALMVVAIDKGAEHGQSFLQYVDYLESNALIPPTAKSWIDRIRTQGNIANHEVVELTLENAKEMISFLEMLLKLVYEFPGRASV